MEETDGILIENLRKLGCNFDDDMTSFAKFTTEDVIEGVVRCLRAIQPDLQLNHKMPPNLPARYKLCMEIATACTDVGFKGDLGYETFLHGSQAELRKVFNVLIQKLPKINEQPIIDSNPDPFQHTLKRIQNDILSQIHKPWLPHFCIETQKQYRFYSSDLLRNVQSNKKLGQLSVIPRTEYVPTIIEDHNSELALEKYKFKFSVKQDCHKFIDHTTLPTLPSRFALIRLFQYSNVDKKTKKPQPPPKPSHLTGSILEVSRFTFEEQCHQLYSELEKLERIVALRQTELAGIVEEMVNMQSLIKLKEKKQSDQQKEVDRKEKLYALLPEAPTHLEHMKNLLEISKQKMSLLEEQWLGIKIPLEDQHKTWMERHRSSENEKLRASLDNTVMSLRQVIEEIRTKDNVIEILQSRLDSLPSSALTRTFYTQRILSIVANVKKQNEEMERVLQDVKCVQREINSIQGKVERTFTVTDEVIFRIAKSDEIARRIYKYLITLHADCSDILKLVKESGNLSREIKDLEEQAETEIRKSFGTKFKQLQSDLEQIRCENQALEQRIKTEMK